MNHIARMLAGIAAVLPLTAIGQTTFHVANNGLDGPGCGTDTSPCRSISAAIAAATDGDSVLVRPGRYGELDGDDALGSPGEETGSFHGAVHVNKRIQVLSTEGAGATVIHGVSGKAAVVDIDADGAQFGERNQGFTLYGASSVGVTNNNMASGKIAGNVAHGMPVGFNIVSIGGEVEVSHNQAIANTGAGIIGATAGDTTGATFIHHNTVIGTGDSNGITVSAIGAHRVVANTVTGNFIGVQVGVGPSRVARNHISNNALGVAYAGQCLFCTPAPSGTPTIVRNSIVGNRNTALHVNQLSEYPLTFRNNNLFGNGFGCAIDNSSTQPIDARQNFWGDATGPGFTDPADGVCSTHDVVRTTPFATSEIVIE